MTAAEQCKAAGMKSLAELSEMVRKPTQTLRNWHRDSPELFAIVIAGAVVMSKYHVSLVEELKRAGMLEAVSAIESEEAEVERLNAQIAMLREALKLMRNSAESYGKSWASAHVADYAALVSGSSSKKYELLAIAQKRLQSVPDALVASYSDWLTQHDAKIRDDTLEYAAVKFEADKGYGDWSREFIARDLRDMKDKR